MVLLMRASLRAGEFFEFARERHAVHLRRRAGQSPPFTQDPVIQQYKFTNVFRELDRTTVWFRENVRDPKRHDADAILSTMVFRWFNRVTTGEAVFTQRNLFSGRSAYDDFRDTGDVGHLRSAILAYCGDGPYVTGAFIVNTPTGSTKLEGVLGLLGRFWEGDWLEVGQGLLEGRGRWTIEDVAEWLTVEHERIGWFNAYEVASDLRWTDMLDMAPDIMTWANPGPGATRGLNRVHGRYVGDVPPREQLIGEMRELLDLSRRPGYWPQEVPRAKLAGSDWGWTTQGFELVEEPLVAKGAWPAWEMREVEHTLCEADKYWRLQEGGHTKGRFHGGR